MLFYKESLLNLDNLFNTISLTSSINQPPVEIIETVDNIQVKIQLPGINIKDIDCRVTEKVVYISGERKKNEVDSIVTSEFNYGSFKRIIPLPNKIQNTSVTNEYKDGILTLTLLKAEADKNKVVKVEF